MKSSLGYLDNEDDELAADALPSATEDRASANLRSPSFQLPAEKPEASTPKPSSFGTPLASALGNYTVPEQPQQVPASNLPEPAPSFPGASVDSTLPVPDFGANGEPAAEAPEVPEANQPADNGSLATPQLIAPPPTLATPRELKGAHSPEVAQALAQYGQLPAQLPVPRHLRPDDRNTFLRAQASAEQQAKQQQASIHHYLSSVGVETELSPDGSHLVAIHPDGATRWKPTMGQPFQDPDSGRWLIKSRDDRGNVRDLDLFSTKGLVHTDTKTGARYIVQNGQAIDLGTPDETVLERNKAMEERNALAAQAQARALKVAEITASVEPAKTLLRQLESQTVSGSDGYSRGKSVRQLANVVTTTGPSVAAGTASEIDKAAYEAAKEGLTRFQQDHPEYNQAHAAVQAAHDTIAALKAETRADESRRLNLALNPRVSSAAQSLLPDSLKPYTPGGPDDANPAQVENDAASLAASDNLTQGNAMSRVLRQMKASGVQTMGGKPIDDAIRESRMPPPPRPTPEAPAATPEPAHSIWKNFIGSVLNTAANTGQAALETGERVLASGADKIGATGASEYLTHAADANQQERKWRQELATGAYSPENPYQPGGAKSGFNADFKGANPLIPRLSAGGEYIDPAQRDNVLTGVAHVAPDLAIMAGTRGAAMPLLVGQAALTGAAEAGDKGESRLAGGVIAGAKALATMKLFGLAGELGGRLVPEITGTLARFAAAAGITIPVNLAADAIINKVFGGNAVPQTPAEWAERGLFAIFFAGHSAYGEAKLPGQVKAALEQQRTLPEKIQSARLQLEALDQAKQRVQGDLDAHVDQYDAARKAGLTDSLAAFEKARTETEKFIEMQRKRNPRLLAKIDERTAQAVDAAKTAAAGQPLPTPPEPLTTKDVEEPAKDENAADSPTDTARSFTGKLKVADALRQQIADKRAKNEPSPHERDMLSEVEGELHEEHGKAVSQVPEGARETIAKLVSPEISPKAADRHFSENPEAAFSSAAVGRELRDQYVSPERQAQVEHIANKLGSAGHLARFVADQHTGMQAAKDLVKVAQGQPIEPGKAEGLARLGLVEAKQDGGLSVRHDALALLPRGLVARLRAEQHGFQVEGVPGEKLAGADALTRAGRRHLENALHARAQVEREAEAAAKAPKTHMVRIEFTDPENGHQREHVMHVPAHSEEAALAKATSRVERTGAKLKVTHAEVTTPEKEIARREAREKAEKEAKAEAARREKEAAEKKDAIQGSDLAASKAKPAEPEDFTDEEHAVAQQVYDEFDRPQNRRVFHQLGVKRAALVKGTEGSGMTLADNGHLLLDPKALKAQFDYLTSRGIDPKEWARHALREEMVHAAQFASVPDWVSYYTKVHSDLPPELLKAAAETYEGFEELPPHAQGAEAVRLVLQQRYHGTITEAVFKAIEKVVQYLRGIDAKDSPLLQDAIQRAETVLKEARARAKEQAAQEKAAARAAREAQLAAATSAREARLSASAAGEQDPFGMPAMPKTLPEGHPLLRPTHEINTPEREALREQWVQDALTEKPPIAPGQKPVLFVLGGGYAAGKSTILEHLISQGTIDREHAVYVAADRFKEERIPEYKEIEARGDGRSGQITHLESNHLAHTTLERALELPEHEQRHIIYDSSFRRPTRAQALINKARAHGFEVIMVGVTMRPKEALGRSIGRARKNNRWMDPVDLLQSHLDYNAALPHYLDIWPRFMLFDNTGPERRLVLTKGSRGIDVKDPELYAEIERRANERATIQTPDDLRRYVGVTGISGETGEPRSGGVQENPRGERQEGSRDPQQGADPLAGGLSSDQPGESLSASAAERLTPKQREEQRLAELRARREGWQGEQQQASAAPAEVRNALTREEGKAVVQAYDRLVKKSGFRAVSIADLAEHSGQPLEKVKAQILASERAGAVVLSKGDWSLADDRTRAGAVELRGEKMMQARLLSKAQADGLSASKAKMEPDHGLIGIVDSYGAVHTKRTPTEAEFLKANHAEVFGARAMGADRFRYDPIAGIEWTREPIDEARHAAENWLHSRGMDPQGLPNGLGASKSPRYFKVPYAPLGVPDLIDHIVEQGGIKLPPKEKRTGPEWDDLPGNLRGIYRQLVSAGGKMGPDELADMLHSQGLLREPDVRDLWSELEKTINTRRSMREQQASQEKEQSALQRTADKQGRAFEKAATDPKQGQPIHVEQLQVGDHVQVGTERMEVTGIDEEDFTVALQDGSKFGLQHVRDGETIFGELNPPARKPTPRQIGRAEGRESARARMAPKIAALSAKLSESVSKVTAYLETLRQAERAGKEGRKAGEAEMRHQLLQADKWLAADAAHLKTDLVNLIQDELPPAERGAFLSQVAGLLADRPSLKGDPARPYREAAKIVAKVMDRAEQVHREEVIDEIKEVAAKAVKSPSVDVNYQKKLRALVGRYSFVRLSEAKRAELESRRDFVRQQELSGNPAKIPAAELAELKRLTLPHVSELSTHALEAMRARVYMDAEFGRLTLKLRERAYDREKNGINAEVAALDHTGKGTGERSTPFNDRQLDAELPSLTPDGKGGLSASQRFTNAWTSLMNHFAIFGRAIMPMDAVLDSLGAGKGRYDGVLFRRFRGPIDLNYNNAIIHLRELNARVESVINHHKLEAHNSKRIGIFAIAKQEGGRERLNAQGIPSDVIDAISSSLSPGEMAAYREMRAVLDELYPQIRELMRTLYNEDVPAVKDYWPLPRDWSAYEQSADAPPPLDPRTGKPVGQDELTTWRWLKEDVSPKTTTSVAKGFTKERQAHAASAVRIDGFEVFRQHITDAVHLLHQQRTLKMLGEVARSPEFAEKFGRRGREIVLGWLDTIATNGGSSSAQRWKVIDWVRTHTSVGILALRPGSQLANLAALPMAAYHAGGIDALINGARLSTTPEGKRFLAERFADIQEREGSEPAQKEAVSTFGKVAEVGFAVSRFIDQFNARSVALGRYLYEMRQRGYSEAEALNPAMGAPRQAAKESLEQATVRVRRAVNNSAGKDLPQTLSRGVGFGGNVSASRAVFQFKSDSLNRWSGIVHDLWKAGFKERDPKIALYVASAILGSMGVELMVKQMTRAGLNAITGHVPKDDDDLAKRALQVFLQSHPLADPITQAVIDQRTGVPAFDAPVGAAHELYLATKAKDGDGLRNHIVRGIGGLLATAGVPGAGQATDIAARAMPANPPSEMDKFLHKHGLPRHPQKKDSDGPTRQDIIESVRSGKVPPAEAFKTALKQGISVPSARAAVAEGLKPEMLAEFERMPLERAIEVYRAADKDPDMDPQLRRRLYIALQHKHAAARAKR